MFDYLIIGAGISGASVAYLLQKEGKHVGVVDERGIAGGGSGAAGAFLSPKVGKGGELKEIINQAYLFSLAFYQNNFPQFLEQYGVVQIPKDEEDAHTFDDFLKQATTPTRHLNPEELTLVQDVFKNESLLFEDGALADAKKICEAMLEEVDFFHQPIVSLNFHENLWECNGLIARHIILAQGAYGNLLQEEYLNIRPVWGERLDIKTATPPAYILHKNLSISAQKKDGKVAIGATHRRFVLELPCQEEDETFLLHEANALHSLKEVEVIERFCGARAGSIDYFPLIGKVVNSDATLTLFPALRHGSKVDTSHYIFYPNLFIINGLSGRGFVLGPYIASLLVDQLIHHKEPPFSLLTLRLFNRWVKKKVKD